MESIIIVGGDKRQSYLKDIFIRKGYICEHVNAEEEADILEQIESFDAVLLPVPLSKDKEHIYSDNESFSVKIKDVISKMNNNQTLFAGSIDKTLGAFLREREISYYDYFSEEALVIYNAYLTAQGALRLLLENTDELLVGKKTLITGYGRVAKAVAEILMSNGADVYIAARNAVQLQEAECRGYKTVDICSIGNLIFLFSYIFNTVPAEIFSKGDIRRFKGKYFELASAPFGVSREEFYGKYEDYISGAALPGKYLPLSAAEKIAEIVLQYMKE